MDSSSLSASFTVKVIDRNGNPVNMTIKSSRRIGKGTFGMVFEIEDLDNRKFCVKRVYQDPHYKNRELSILSMLDHPNCIYLYGYFQIREKDKIFFNLITDLFPQDLSHFVKVQTSPQPSLICIFAYQIFKGLSYIHSKGICHRDLKPANVLVDSETGRLKLCDFGTAKIITSKDVSVSYIATRNYRAPELLFGCELYKSAVDIWAAGCIIAELCIGFPIFSGDSNSGMVSSIVGILGSPTEQDMIDMNGKLAYNGPLVKDVNITSVLPEWVDPNLVDLLSQIFVYSPSKRATADNLLEHRYFAEIKSGSVLLPNGKEFTAE